MEEEMMRRHFFDLSDPTLNAAGELLERPAVVYLTSSCLRLEGCRGAVNRGAAKWAAAQGRLPFDLVLMLKMLVLQALSLRSQWATWAHGNKS
jgi:hypothetical protein